ncbi:MAG: hypothetical protein AB1424_01950 [Thermodesulfobacteriota bacterium]
MSIFGYSPEICGRPQSLYSMDPDKFQEADAQLTELERRQEWTLLHGDGTTVESLNKDNDLCNGQHSLEAKHIGCLADESESLKLTA